MTPHDELRKLAETVIRGKENRRSMHGVEQHKLAVHDFNEAANPAQVIALLDEIKEKDAEIAQFDAHNKHLASALAERLAELSRLRATFHVNMMKAHPGKSHAEISAAIDAALGQSPAQPDMVKKLQAQVDALLSLQEIQKGREERRERRNRKILDMPDAPTELIGPQSLAQPAQHPDDVAVDRFAAAMKAKLSKKRKEGRGGWDDEDQCEMTALAEMLMHHIAKGDPVDIANFCMMLHQREQMAVEHHPCHGGSAQKAIQKAAQQPAQEAFQQRVEPWLLACFGEEISADTVERNHRFFEEAAELVQACGMPKHEAHQLVEYVYGRPIGEPNQEAGGVMVTLAALCRANNIDMHASGETELARIWTKVEQIRAKQAAKPRGSALPVVQQPAQAVVPEVMSMVNRFLSWKLPKNFNPDAGISFSRPSAEYEKSGYWPIGTNLFDARQAKEMVEFMLNAAPDSDGGGV